MAELAGPKIGDARSLWNFTPSPGWTKEEAATLRLCLMKFGVGMWVQIVESGVLPGKQIQQLNGQTQRLLGQQSLAEFTRLKVDVDRIREDNDAKQGPEIFRKSGLITNTGGKLKPERLKALRAANVEKYGISDEVAEAIVLPPPPAAKNLGADAYMGKNHNRGGIAGRRSLKRSRREDVLVVDVDALSRPNKIALLTALRARLVALRETGAKTDAASPEVLKETQAVKVKKESAASAKKAKKAAPASAAKGKKKPKGKKENDADPATLAALQSMGFDAKKALEAVEIVGEDVEQCVQWLVVNCCFE